MKILSNLFKKKSDTLKQQSKMEKSDDCLQNVEVQQTSIPRQAPTRGYVFANKVRIDYNDVSKLIEKYIAFDIETTGLSPTEDRIIEVGAAIFENGEVTATYSSLVNAGRRISSRVTAINNITNDMIVSAPTEDEVYEKLVQFLDNALTEQVIVCAYNAKFDMDFLSESLMRHGYNAQINYVDVLSLTRNVVNGLDNYKQGTVATHFGFDNKNTHRALPDAEVCGKILWKLLPTLEEEAEKSRARHEKSKPTGEELEICAFIQDSIVKQGGDVKWLGFEKNSSNYVSVSYLYSFLKFKLTTKIKYIIVAKSAVTETLLQTEPCTMTEGGTDYIRVHFNSPFELTPLTEYFFYEYEKYRKSALEYLGFSSKRENEAKQSPAMSNTLTVEDVSALLVEAERRMIEYTTKTISSDIDINQTGIRINRNDIMINPVNDRKPLSDIRNLGDWQKGFEEGFNFYDEGETLRKSGDVETAIMMFDKARYNGYDAPALYNSYAKVYAKLKDYDNEIQILEEAIERGKSKGHTIGHFEARRDRALQLLHKRIENKRRAEQKQEEASQKKQIKKSEDVTPKKPVGRAILQFSDEMVMIKRYDSIANAVRETGVNSKSIRDAANGVQKRAGGFVWKYEGANDAK